MNAPAELPLTARAAIDRQATVANALLEFLPPSSVLWKPADTRPL